MMEAQFAIWPQIRRSCRSGAWSNEHESWPSAFFLYVLHGKLGEDKISTCVGAGRGSVRRPAVSIIAALEIGREIAVA
jgi:hypothetical protein